jgi:5-methylcytosine-specific restriction endonuclease McrA
VDCGVARSRSEVGREWKRESDRRRVESGENRERMLRRSAAELGLSLEQYRELQAVRSVSCALRRAAKMPPRRSIACVICGQSFETRSERRVTCGSSECVRKYGSRATSDAIMRRYRSDPEFRDKVLAQAHARRASKLGIGDRRITVGYLLQRDGWQCGICHKRIRRRKDASLDHIVPLARGGTHDLANVQVTHLFCNYSKGDRGGGEQLRLVG